jgi:hypothetical protein
MAHKKGAYANGTTVYTPSAITAGPTNEEALA